MQSRDTDSLFKDYFASPIGVLEIMANENAISALRFSAASNAARPNAITTQAIKQLDEYFNGDRRAFNLPLEANGTAFQQRVWQALLTIPAGQTTTYSTIAAAVDNPKAVRAVGAANGKNPIGIIVPCHRVIGSDGTLTGYAHGIDKKQWLLEHERCF